MEEENLKDKTFGYLTVLNKTNKKIGSYYIWECMCKCGNLVYVNSRYLIIGHTKSCGCLNRELSSKRLKSDTFKEARELYRKNNFLKEGTSLAILKSKEIKNSNSGRKGVTWEKSIKKWRAKIYFKGKNYSLGCFINLEDAIKAREEAEEKYFKPILEKYNSSQIYK